MADGLIDDWMPESDVRASHATRIAASPERVYACLRTTDFDHWGLTRALFAVRALPAFVAAPRETWRRARVAASQEEMKVAGRRSPERDEAGASFACERPSAAAQAKTRGGDVSISRAIVRRHE